MEPIRHPFAPLTLLAATLATACAFPEYHYRSDAAAPEVDDALVVDEVADAAGADVDHDADDATTPPPDDVDPSDASSTTDDLPPEDVARCAEGESLCDGACVDLRVTAAHCGACGSACRADQLCLAGACACATGAAECSVDGGVVCLDTRADQENCGACGVRCRAEQRCVEGSCACVAGLAECTVGANTACVDTRTDTAHCGACNTACPVGRRCVEGACVCPAGEALCGDACVRLDADVTNCGACATRCPSGASCQAGACVCPAGTTACAGACVDTQSDRDHCGACGRVCPAGEVCQRGACTLVCEAPSAPCVTPTGRECVALASSREHCGACNRACRADMRCVGGACACASGLTDCDGRCVDTRSDNAHCGRCGTPCSGGQSCVTGACVCPMGQSLCGTRCLPTGASCTSAGAGGCQQTGTIVCAGTTTACSATAPRTSGACTSPTGGQCNASGACVCPAGQSNCGGVCRPTGASCSTGQPGRCAAGRVVCSGTGTTCERVFGPVAETCNAADDNCNGRLDDGVAACGMRVQCVPFSTTTAAVTGRPFTVPLPPGASAYAPVWDIRNWNIGAEADGAWDFDYATQGTAGTFSLTTTYGSANETLDGRLCVLAVYANSAAMGARWNVRAANGTSATVTPTAMPRSPFPGGPSLFFGGVHSYGSGTDDDVSWSGNVSGSSYVFNVHGGNGGSWAEGTGVWLSLPPGYDATVAPFRTGPTATARCARSSAYNRRETFVTLHAYNTNGDDYVGFNTSCSDTTTSTTCTLTATRVGNPSAAYVAGQVVCLQWTE